MAKSLSVVFWLRSNVVKCLSVVHYPGETQKNRPCNPDIVSARHKVSILGDISGVEKSPGAVLVHIATSASSKCNAPSQTQCYAGEVYFCPVLNVDSRVGNLHGNL